MIGTIRETLRREKIFSQFHHFGVCVADIERARVYYEALGLGTFQPSQLRHINRRINGLPAPDVKVMGMCARLGQVGFELVQPVSGDSVQKRWLDQHGEGINHICFVVDDIHAASDLLVGAGYRIISASDNEGGGGMAYFNTERVGGVQIEFEQIPPHLADDPFWGLRPWALV